jgi:hypothetical protein
MENWVERKTPQGRPYFCNLVTQETTWDFDEIDSETGHLVRFTNIPQFLSTLIFLSYCYYYRKRHSKMKKNTMMMMKAKMT